jgi:hypothetical protein
MASIRERWAKASGKDKEKFRESASGKEYTNVEEYFKEQRKQARKKAKISTERYKQDFQNLMQDLGVMKSQALEDYTTNLDRIRENKETGLESLDYFVKTQTERTEEDLDESLAKEARRFELNLDRKQRSLASKGLTFGGLGGIRQEQEGLVKQEHQDVVGELKKQAKRSFQDIQRQEFVKNREIEQRFEREKEDIKKTKKRTLADINQQKRDASLTKERSLEDVSLNKEQSLREYEYQENEAKANIESTFKDYYRNNEKKAEEQIYFG